MRQIAAYVDAWMRKRMHYTNVYIYECIAGIYVQCMHACPSEYVRVCMRLHVCVCVLV